MRRDGVYVTTPSGTVAASGGGVTFMVKHVGSSRGLRGLQLNRSDKLINLRTLTSAAGSEP